jgi:hypothetical protein
MATPVSAQLDLLTQDLIASNQLNVTTVSTEPKETLVILAQMIIVNNALMKLVSAGPVKQVLLL